MATVNVKNISNATSESEVKEFFSFCGKVSDIRITTDGDTQVADVTFEKETACKTALLLNNTQLGPNHISVTSTTTADADEEVVTNDQRDSDEITQEEKPRARIIAEYLAHGYVVGDATIQRALELDQKHNVSSRFLNTLNKLDSKYHATDRAKAADQNYGISQRANNLFTGLNSYFEKASNHPTGKKIVRFYEDSSKHVQEVHAEARRLADLREQQYGGDAYKASGLAKVFGRGKDRADTDASAAAASQSTAAEKSASTVDPTPDEKKV